MFWLGAFLVGAVCALFAVLSEYAYGLFQMMVEWNPLLPLLVTPLTLVWVAWLTNNYFSGSQGSGIPQAIASLKARGRHHLLSIRIAIGKILLTLAGLAAGASIGREGPSVHVGAALMYSLGRYARFPAHYMRRGLILAGGAAGVAAAFNTPLAGVVFAIEEMSRSFEQRSSGIVITAVVFSGLVALGIQGQYHYFGTSNASMPEMQHWLAVPLAGILGGMLGGLFSFSLLFLADRVAPLAARQPYRVALVCGVLVALFGYVSGYHTSGTGYDVAKSIVTDVTVYDPWLPLLKMGATLASYLSGIPGGIFAPALATGAGVGAELGHWLGVAPLQAMVILGMVAYFSGVVQAPITAFVIVMEMTNDQDMLLPLMATSFIAYGSSTLVCPRSLYRTMAEAFVDR